MMMHESSSGSSSESSSGSSRSSESSRQRNPEYLTETQVKRFIVEGFLVLPDTELGPAFHDAIFSQVAALGPEAEVLGNNVLPAIPELARVFETRQCRGALESLLGPGYMMHPHRFAHRSEPGRPAQTWHRDSYWGHTHARDITPWWVMGMYYPQDTCGEALGPTDVLPRSQYFSKDIAGEAERTKRGPFATSRFADKMLDGSGKQKGKQQRKGKGKGKAPGKLSDVGHVGRHWHVKRMPTAAAKGTVVLIHYDLWHRGSGRSMVLPAGVREGGLRIMFKFQFSRMVR